MPTTRTTQGISNRKSAAEESAERAAHPPRPAESRMHRIAQRAHEIYQARGGEHGKALEDWLTAEREIDEEIDRALVE
jgi:hypothetical protein